VASAADDAQGPELLRELRGLERRSGGARDTVDHRPGAHDDRSNEAAIALVLAAAGGVSSPAVARRAMAATREAPPTGNETADGLYAGGEGSADPFATGAGTSPASMRGDSGGSGASKLERDAFGGASGDVFDLGKRAFGD
jgi:hypothetical protein